MVIASRKTDNLESTSDLHRSGLPELPNVRQCVSSRVASLTSQFFMLIVPPTER